MFTAYILCEYMQCMKPQIAAIGENLPDTIRKNFRKAVLKGKERELLPESIEKAATRNMFYDKNGKHVRTPQFHRLYEKA